jgi:transcriptional regulator with XRE-family HTH domain
LAKDNTERQCARCQHLSRDKLIAPPEVPAEFWHTDQFEEAFAAQHMGWVARVYRTHPYQHAVYGPGGISQTLLGQWLGVGQPQISRYETGPPIEHLDTLQHWAQTLRIPPRRLWFQLPAEKKRQPATTAPAVGHPANAGASNGVLEPPTEIVARRAELQTSGLTGELVAELEQFLLDLPDRYETAGPLILAPEVVDARRLVHRLLKGNQRLKQRAQLFELAGRLSGLLSYMAVNLGNFNTAQAYGAEAFELARFIEHDELTTWVRGTQSFAAYYTGNYKRSLILAQDGQRYAKDSLQAVRLVINGEARALGKLQDRRGADEAVTRAYRLLERFPPAAGMTPCISFGIYSEARTASNAATAYLALKQTKQVLGYAERAREIVDTSSSQWSYALIRLDIAMALLSAEQPEPEGASALGAEALNAVRYQRIESIQQRTRELAIALRPWRHLPTVADFLADVSGWLTAK